MDCLHPIEFLNALFGEQMLNQVNGVIPKLIQITSIENHLFFIGVKGNFGQ
jgi:hypothetical protein